MMKKENWPKRESFFENSQGIPWIIPHSCDCCVKCWLFVDQHGTPSVTLDKMGRPRNHCVYGGPYFGYIEIEENSC